MQKTFELPEPLLHRAAAAAADEGWALERWVQLTIEAKVTAHEEIVRALAASDAALKAFASRLQVLPNGSLYNPDGIDNEGFFDTLQNLRSGRLR